MIPQEVTDFKDAALALLTSQYSATAAPNLRALLGALTTEHQTLEGVLWACITQRQLATATQYIWPSTNAALDGLGALVGQARNGMTDQQLVAVIALRIAINRTNGRAVNWSKFATILLGTVGAGGPIEYYEGTASFFFFVGDMPAPVSDPAAVVQSVGAALPQAVPNGVGPAVFGYSTWADGNDFEWADVNNLSTTGQGTFGDSVAGVVGGLLVSAQELTTPKGITSP